MFILEPGELADLTQFQGTCVSCQCKIKLEEEDRIGIYNYSFNQLQFECPKCHMMMTCQRVGHDTP